MQVMSGPPVPGQLLGAPGRGEALRQIGCRDQLDAGAAQQLRGAGVEARDGRQLVFRAVLGGQAPVALHQAQQGFPMLLPGEVDVFVAG